MNRTSLLPAPPYADTPSAARPQALTRRAVLVVLLGVEALLLGLLFDLPKLSQICRTWADFDGVRLLAFVGLAVAALALLFGRAPAAQALPRVGVLPGGWGRLVLFLLVHVPLLLALLWLTGRIEQGGEAYEDHFLRYAVGWLLLATANLVAWAAALLPARYLAPLLRRAVEPLGATAIACAIVAVGLLTHPAWWYLNQSTLWSVQALSRLFLSDVLYQPAEDLVGTPTYSVTITCPCGGAYGIGLILIFLGVYFWLFRHALRFPATFLLLPLGVSFMWGFNVLRITTMVALRTWNSPVVDVDGFHSQAGWLGFLGVSLGLIAFGRLTGLVAADGVPLRMDSQFKAATAYLAPLLAAVAVMLLSPVFGATFDWLYPLRVAAAGSALWLGRRYFTGLEWRWSWPAVALGIGVFLLWIGLEPLAPAAASGAALQTALAGLPPTALALWLAFRVLGSVVTVPLAEELAFRGFLTRRLIAVDFQSVPATRFTLFSCLVSSLLFGGLHGRWVAGTLAGVVYALAVYRRGKLSDGVLAHATTNGLLACHVLLTGSWSFWS